MRVSEVFWGAAILAFAQGCGGSGGSGESTAPPEPEPFRSSSQLSFFDLKGSFEATYGMGSSLAIIRTTSGREVVGTLTGDPWSYAIIRAGGYDTERPEEIDQIELVSGAFAKEPFEPSLGDARIFLTLADRIDEEGGATDVFNAELQGYASSPARARVVIFNTDHDTSTDYDFAAVIHWDVNFDGWGDFDPFEAFGTSTLVKDDWLERKTIGSGIATFDGMMLGMYRPARGSSEEVSGSASLTMDFSTHRLEGEIVDVATASTDLQDIVLELSEPRSHLGYGPHEPFTGAAYTGDYNADTETATMTGRYDAVLHQDPATSSDLTTPSDYLTGNVAISGPSGDLVGGIVARR